jgi:DNA adenine methylase
MNKPFAWYGGKGALAPFLTSLLPPHRVYCEVFGGSGALLFANPDPVEKARQWYCAVMQSMNSSIRATGWSCTKIPDSHPARAWRNSIPHLAACVGRLAQVQIDHRDFEAVIRAYDSPDTLFYLDPPYLPETRRKRECYRHEMTLADHERFLSCTVQIKGMVLLSGYDHPRYQDALSGWECRSLTQLCSSAVRPTIAPEARTRQECLWRNPRAVQRSQELFPLHAAAFEEEVNA